MPFKSEPQSSTSTEPLSKMARAPRYWLLVSLVVIVQSPFAVIALGENETVPFALA
jgi:hypothetical protein